MKKYLLFLIIVVCILFVGCTKETEWNEFTWIDYSDGDQRYDKAAIFIPIRFSGIDEQYYLQLDTGATSVLNGNSFREIKTNYEIIAEENQEPSIVSIDGILANYKFIDKNFRILQDYGATLEELENAEYKKVGSIGLDFFKDSILILNFPQEKLIVVSDQKDIPKYIKENSNFLDINLQNNKLYLNSTIGDKDLTLFYDTGASIFHIVTTEKIWNDLTDIKSDESVKLLELPSWGRRVQLKGARAESDWRIGGLVVEKPLVFYEASGLEDFNFEAIEADGLLGNAIFYDNYIVTIDLINNKFGIMKVKQ